jgi:hypothetical protein
MKCKHCGKEVELPFKCNFCGSYFCFEHRLPENHDCHEAPIRTPLGSWETKQKLMTAREEREKEESIMISQGEFHFIKKEMPLFDTKKSLSNQKKKKSRFSLSKWKKKGVES